VSGEQQRVINNTPIITLSRITNAPAIMKSRNPMAKQAVKTTPLVHQQVTRNNTPGGVPLIQQAGKHTAIDDNNAMPAVATRTKSTIPMAQTRLIYQWALSAVTIWEDIMPPPAYSHAFSATPLPHCPTSILNITQILCYIP
jgi:hypothetical protein